MAEPGGLSERSQVKSPAHSNKLACFLDGQHILLKGGGKQII